MAIDTNNTLKREVKMYYIPYEIHLIVSAIFVYYVGCFLYNIGKH